MRTVASESMAGRRRSFPSIRGTVSSMSPHWWHWISTARGKRNRVSQQPFDVPELVPIFSCDKTRRPSGGLHPSRSSDSMDIIFRTVGQVEIDHMADVRHIDPAGGD